MLDGLNNAMEYPDTKMAKAEYLNPEDLTLLQNEESLSLLQSNFSSSSCHLEVNYYLNYTLSLIKATLVLKQLVLQSPG